MLLTIGAASDVLDLFTPDAPERGVTEVSQIAGISKSKAHELLSSLAAVGLLRRTPRGRYRLGWRILELGGVLDQTTDLSRLARPVMQSVARSCGEAVHLAALDGERVRYLGRALGQQAVDLIESTPGATLPAHCSGLGKMVLAQLPDEELDVVLGRCQLDRRTDFTITDERVLRQEIAEVRLRGHAYDLDEARSGVSCVAAPIQAPDTDLVAAISIAVPSRRMQARERAYTRLALRAASHVSRLLRELADAEAMALAD